MPLKDGFSVGGLIQPAQAELFTPGSDLYWMKEALHEARFGIGITSPNPAVGCVIVDRHGKEMARGSTQAFRGKHAERVALEKISDPNRLEQGTLYVTLEPCSHFGHQPPCLDAILHSPLRRIVIAHADPNPRVGGEGIRKLKAAGKEVLVGVLSEEARAWNFPFLAHQVLKRPAFILKWAQTLDGQLADDSHTSQWITGHPARAYTHWLRQKYDAILVGGRTVIRDFPSLNVRDCAPPQQAQPLPIIFDPKGLCLNVSRKNQDLLSEKTFSLDRPVVYISSHSAPRSWLAKKSQILFLTLKKPSIPNLISLLEKAPLSKVRDRPLQSIMVEGGPQTLTSFLRAGYGDLLHVFIAPTLTGGKKYRIQLNNLLKNSFRYELLTSLQFGSDITMEMVSEATYAQIFNTDFE